MYGIGREEMWEYTVYDKGEKKCGSIDFVWHRERRNVGVYFVWYRERGNVGV